MACGLASIFAHNSRSFMVCQRQIEIERRPGANLTAHREPATVALDYFTRNSQPETGAVLATRSLHTGPSEYFEQLGQILVWNTLALVSDRHCELLPGSRKLYLYVGLRMRILHRIANQIV